MIIHRFPAIDQAIWNKAGDLDAPIEKKLEQGRHHHVTIPDATILEMRRLHEIERKTIQQVQKMYPDINGDYVRNVLSYIVRTNLRVRP